MPPLPSKRETPGSMAFAIASMELVRQWNFGLRRRLSSIPIPVSSTLKANFRLRIWYARRPACLASLWTHTLSTISMTAPVMARDSAAENPFAPSSPSRFFACCVHPESSGFGGRTINAVSPSRKATHPARSGQRDSLRRPQIEFRETRTLRNPSSGLDCWLATIAASSTAAASEMPPPLLVKETGHSDSEALQ